MFSETREEWHKAHYKLTLSPRAASKVVDHLLMRARDMKSSAIAQTLIIPGILTIENAKYLDNLVCQPVHRPESLSPFFELDQMFTPSYQQASAKQRADAEQDYMEVSFIVWQDLSKL